MLHEATVKTLFLLKCTVVVITFLGDKTESRDLTNEERIAYLDATNWFRYFTARGYTGTADPVKTMPRATKMTLLSWDDDLEKQAQQSAEKCQIRHTNGEINLPNYPSVGQNLVVNYRAIPGAQVKAFFDEFPRYFWSKYDTTEKIYRGVVGHFLQLVNDRAKSVGCGTHVCNGSTLLTYCNYGPGYNVPNQYTYSKGEPCTECEPGYSWCVGGHLCATDEICKQAGRTCTCKVKCKNGGVIDPKTCTCKCPPQFNGFYCDNSCNNTASWCEWKSINDPVKYGSYCRLKFNLCTQPTTNPVFPNVNKIYSWNYNKFPYAPREGEENNPRDDSFYKLYDYDWPPELYPGTVDT